MTSIEARCTRLFNELINTKYGSLIDRKESKNTRGSADTMTIIEKQNKIN